MNLSITRRQLFSAGASTLALAAAARRAVAQAPAPMPEPLLAKGQDRRKNVYNALAAIDSRIAPALKNKKYVLIKPNNVSTVRQLAATNVDALRGILDYLSTRFR